MSIRFSSSGFKVVFKYQEDEAHAVTLNSVRNTVGSRLLIITLAMCMTVEIVALQGCGPPTTSKAQGVIHELISGKPIAGVSVEVACNTDTVEDRAYSHRKATSGTDGSYTLKPLLPERPYHISLSKEGYCFGRIIGPNELAKYSQYNGGNGRYYANVFESSRAGTTKTLPEGRGILSPRSPGVWIRRAGTDTFEGASPVKTPPAIRLDWLKQTNPPSSYYFEAIDVERSVPMLRYDDYIVIVCGAQEKGMIAPLMNVDKTKEIVVGGKSIPEGYYSFIAAIGQTQFITQNTNLVSYPVGDDHTQWDRSVAWYGYWFQGSDSSQSHITVSMNDTFLLAFRARNLLPASCKLGIITLYNESTVGNEHRNSYFFRIEERKTRDG